MLCAEGRPQVVLLRHADLHGSQVRMLARAGLISWDRGKLQSA